jgi:acetaldehyde dehydrogenase (acetylating)
MARPVPAEKFPAEAPVPSVGVKSAAAPAHVVPVVEYENAADGADVSVTTCASDAGHAPPMVYVTV